MIRRASLVYNPASGGGKAEEQAARVAEFFGADGIDLRLFAVTPEEGPEKQAEAGLAHDPDVLIACGGDGTISAVAGVAANHGKPLGILPGGTANAFAMALGIPRDLRAACDVILSGSLRSIDLAECDGRPMTLLVAVGFEAEVVSEVDAEDKRVWGPLAYYVEGLVLLPKRSTFHARLTIDEESYEAEADAITVANAAPPTSGLAQGLGEVVLDDGLLDVTIMHPATFLETVETAAQIAHTMLTRQAPDCPHIEARRARRVLVTATPPQLVAVDGDVVGRTPIEVVCRPKALQVFVPIPAGDTPDGEDDPAA